MGGDTVLVVDDEGGVRRLVAKHISHLGLPTAQAQDAQAGLAYLAAHGGQVAVVVSDINMPRATGIELLRRVKESDDTIQVVMVRGMNDLGTVRECEHREALRRIEIDSGKHFDPRIVAAFETCSDDFESIRTRHGD